MKVKIADNVANQDRALKVLGTEQTQQITAATTANITVH